MMTPLLSRTRSYLTIIFSLHWLLAFVKEALIQRELIYVPVIQDYFNIISLLYWFAFPFIITLILLTKNKLNGIDFLGLISWPFVIATGYIVLELKSKL